MEQVAVKLGNLLGSRPGLMHADPASHVHESASILQQRLGAAVALQPDLRGIDLGILAGLSRTEAAARFPAAADSLDAWRRGEIRSPDLEIPGAEPIGDFERRIRAVLESTSASRMEAVILVASRSALTMLANLLQLGAAFDYASYVPYDIPSGGFAAWARGTGTAHWELVEPKAWTPPFAEVW